MTTEIYTSSRLLRKTVVFVVEVKSVPNALAVVFNLELCVQNFHMRHLAGVTSEVPSKLAANIFRENLYREPLYPFRRLASKAFCW